jgi:hypothetical protein
VVRIGTDGPGTDSRQDDAVQRLSAQQLRQDVHSAEARWIDRLGVLISVRCDNEAVLQALTDFYRPYYLLNAGRPPRSPDVTLTLLIDGRHPVPIPSRDMRIFRVRPRHRAYADGWDMRVRHDIDVHIAVDDARRHVVILGSSADEVQLQARVLLRDQMLQRIEHRAGSGMFHAAAAARDGRGCFCDAHGRPLPHRRSPSFFHPSQGHSQV